MLKREDTGIEGKSSESGGSSSSNGNGNGGSSSSSSTTTQIKFTTVTATAGGGTRSTTVTEPMSTPADPINSGGQAIPILTPSPTFNQTPPSPPAVVSPSTASSTSLRVFIFDDPANATLCSPFILSWSYSGQGAVAMTLIAQPRDGSKLNSTVSPSSTSPETRILTTSVLSTADSFTWSSVDAKEGWYVAKAFDTAATLGISAGSAPFYLKQGNDTGCLVTQPSSTIPMSSQIPPPTLSNPSGSKTSIGAGDIVGITLGITAGLICLLFAAFTFPRLKQHNPFIAATKTGQPRLLY
ncbi:hypothetical protein HYPSUDRAFT_947689 [Hypholoma sublateritium FD-334 SS-4]|uniref:Uncharacterized protein n=1 Tax=Hypholoma sublateritium (strain FD-334 SS-4) TaxID=945553 RepID=A0A0D2NP25_HYPSF|nr:hypothetical protein HYPSUDRAFT_947689 [Hypholoma sublateritium FD-334 SS-4]